MQTESQKKEKEIKTDWKVTAALVFNIVITVMVFLSAVICLLAALFIGNYADDLLGYTDVSTGYRAALIMIVLIMALLAVWCIVFCVLCVRQRFEKHAFRKFTVVGQAPIVFIGFSALATGYPSTAIITFALYAAELWLAYSAQWEEAVYESKNRKRKKKKALAEN